MEKFGVVSMQICAYIAHYNISSSSIVLIKYMLQPFACKMSDVLCLGLYLCLCNRLGGAGMTCLMRSSIAGHLGLMMIIPPHLRSALVRITIYFIRTIAINLLSLHHYINMLFKYLDWSMEYGKKIRRIHISVMCA